MQALELGIDFDNLPPIAPGPDETETQDKGFETEALDHLAKTPGRRLGKPLLTTSKQWGLVASISTSDVIALVPLRVPSAGTTRRPVAISSCSIAMSRSLDCSRPSDCPPRGPK